MQWSLRGLEGEAYAAAKLECHRRGAERLRALCFANGGIYIKYGRSVSLAEYIKKDLWLSTCTCRFGQHIAQLVSNMQLMHSCREVSK